MPSIADLNPPDSPNGKDVVSPPTRASWRRWLDANPDRSEGVWVVYVRDKSPFEGPGYMDLVEEALCFGWIDSVVKGVDDDRLIQWFSPRRKGGIWSALTKERLARLDTAGLMTDRGRAAIDTAKSDGSWTAYDPVEALVIPKDLAEALRRDRLTAAFGSLSPSVKKQHLWSVYSAKRPETRTARIQSILDDIR